MANIYLGIIFFLIGLAFWFVNFGHLEWGAAAILVAFVMGLLGFLLPKPKLTPLGELNKKLQMLSLMQESLITRLYRSQSVLERSAIEKDLRAVSLEIEEISQEISAYNLERSDDESTD